MNKELQVAMVKWYNNRAFTHSYIFGYNFKGNVYAATIKNASSLLYAITCLDKASDKCGGGYALKYKPNKAIIEMINAAAESVTLICSVDYLESLNAESRHNRGQLFEGLVQSVLGGELEAKPNAKFTEAGDITISGIAYQIKYNKATFTNEATMTRMGN